MTKKQRKMLRKIIISTIIFFIACIFSFLLPDFPFKQWISLAIFLLAYFKAGGDIVQKALLNIKNGQVFDENFLMSIATIGAFFVGEYPEGVAVMLFYQVGELFQSYAVGKSVEELKTKAIDEHGVVADADLASGATIYMGSFIWAIEAAVNNATHLGAKSGDQLVLTAISSNGSTAASADAEGNASVTSNIIAMTTKENVITSCIIDAVQSKASFDAKGQLIGEVGGDVLSKAQLGADYGLKAYSGIGKEWNEQVEAFCKYVTGKTIEEIQNIALTETTAPADADLAASVSIAVGDFMGLVEKLAK